MYELKKKADYDFCGLTNAACCFSSSQSTTRQVDISEQWTYLIKPETNCTINDGN